MKGEEFEGVDERGFVRRKGGLKEKIESLWGAEEGREGLENPC